MVCVVCKLSQVLTDIVKCYKNMHLCPRHSSGSEWVGPCGCCRSDNEVFGLHGESCFWMRVAPVDPIVYALFKKEKSKTILCYMYAFMLSICLVQLTRLFWPNTCLVSMCISGASRAASKHV